ncbi:MAG: DUF4097 family beta strand repeat protein [Candidatus Delongbacteria bacterium]|nr:DUF4097 family beta strand repeat protein [Candidatus Delongbacteria bacterium]
MNSRINSDTLSVSISTINADVEIIDTEGEELSVDFGELRKNSADEVFDIKFADDKLEIRQKVKKLSAFSDAGDFSVQVSIPKKCKVEGQAVTVSGSIRVSGIGRLAAVFKTKSGDINIADTEEGSCEAGTISGDIMISGVRGAVKTSAISGDTLLTGCVFEKLSAKSVSGDLSASGEFILEENCVINSVSGDIVIDIRSLKTDKEFILKTVSGDVDINGERPAEEKIRISQVKGDFKNFEKFGADISKTFGSAFMNIAKNLKSHLKNVSEDSESVVKEEIRDTKKEQQSVQTILNMVSEGKISVDEAEKLIKALK